MSDIFTKYEERFASLTPEKQQAMLNLLTAKIADLDAAKVAVAPSNRISVESPSEAITQRVTSDPHFVTADDVLTRELDRIGGQLQGDLEDACSNVVCAAINVAFRLGFEAAQDASWLIFDSRK